MKFADDALLVFRHQLGANFNAKLSADRLRRARVVARQHDGLDAHIGQCLQPGLRIRPWLVPHGDGTGKHIADNQHRHSFALVIQPGDQRQLIVRQRHPIGCRLRRSEENLDTLNGRGHTFATESFCIFGRRNLNLFLRGLAENGHGQRMAGPGFERCGQAQHIGFIAVEGDHVGDLWLAFGQSARLVERNGRQLSEGFENRATLEKKPAPRPGGKRGGNGCWCRYDQSARAADQQNGKALVNPFRPDAAHEQRRNGRDECGNHDHSRRIVAGEAVDEPFCRRLRFLRFLDELDHTSNGVVGGGGRDADSKCCIPIDRACKNLVIQTLGDRCAFARHRRFVDRAFAGDDHAVGRDPVTRTHENDRANGEAFRRHFARLPVLLQQSVLRNQFRQGLDARACLACGNALQQFADQEQEHDRSRLFGRIDKQRADSRDCHQHFNGKRRSGQRRHHGASCDGYKADEHRSRKGKEGNGRKKMAYPIG